MATSEQPKLDSVVTAVIQKFQQRAEVGQKKYGTNLDRTDLSVLDWIQHAQEEHMDAILYLEKLKQCVSNQSAPLLPAKEEESKTPVSVSQEMSKEAKEQYYLTHWGC